MSLKLSPEVENAVRERAAAEGVSVNDLLARTFAPERGEPDAAPTPQERVNRLLARWRAETNTPTPPPIPTLPGETPTQALFRKWEEEAARMTDEERAEEDRLWREYQQGLLENGRQIRLHI